MLRRVVLWQLTDVSEVLTASIIRAMSITEIRGSVPRIYVPVALWSPKYYLSCRASFYLSIAFTCTNLTAPERRGNTCYNFVSRHKGVFIRCFNSIYNRGLCAGRSTIPPRGPTDDVKTALWKEGVTTASGTPNPEASANPGVEPQQIDTTELGNSSRPVWDWITSAKQRNDQFWSGVPGEWRAAVVQRNESAETAHWGYVLRHLGWRLRMGGAVTAVTHTFSRHWRLIN
jgi:hypothetical protein